MMNDKDLLLAWGQFDDPAVAILPPELIISLYGDDIIPGGARFADIYREFIIAIHVAKTMSDYSKSSRWENFVSVLASYNFHRMEKSFDAPRDVDCPLSEAVFFSYWQPNGLYGHGSSDIIYAKVAQLCWDASSGHEGSLSVVVEAAKQLEKTDLAERFARLAADKENFFKSGIVMAGNF